MKKMMVRLLRKAKDSSGHRLCSAMRPQVLSLIPTGRGGVTLGYTIVNSSVSAPSYSASAPQEGRMQGGGGMSRCP